VQCESTRLSEAKREDFLSFFIYMSIFEFKCIYICDYKFTISHIWFDNDYDGISRDMEKWHISKSSFCSGITLTGES
jgi:hypothetical protein